MGFEVGRDEDAGEDTLIVAEPGHRAVPPQSVNCPCLRVDRISSYHALAMVMAARSGAPESRPERPMEPKAMFETRWRAMDWLERPPYDTPFSRGEAADQLSLCDIHGGRHGLVIRMPDGHRHIRAQVVRRTRARLGPSGVSPGRLVRGTKLASSETGIGVRGRIVFALWGGNAMDEPRRWVVSVVSLPGCRGMRDHSRPWHVLFSSPGLLLPPRGIET